MTLRLLLGAVTVLVLKHIARSEVEFSENMGSGICDTELGFAVQIRVSYRDTNVIIPPCGFKLN